MNHDFTLVSRASQPAARPMPPDIRDVREHIGVREPRVTQLRQTVSLWLYGLAERIDPRPARSEHDELFDAISALLAEQKCEAPTLETASQRGC